MGESKDYDTRDQALDATYTYPEKGTTSTTLAFVSSNRDSLLVEFFGFDHPPTWTKEEALKIWEQRRFGRELEPCAHGIMMAAVVGKSKTEIGLGPGVEYVKANPRGRREMLEYAEAVAHAMGLEIGSYPKPFPKLSKAEILALREPGEEG